MKMSASLHDSHETSNENPSVAVAFEIPIEWEKTQTNPKTWALSNKQQVQKQINYFELVEQTHKTDQDNEYTDKMTNGTPLSNANETRFFTKHFVPAWLLSASLFVCAHIWCVCVYREPSIQFGSVH